MWISPQRIMEKTTLIASILIVCYNEEKMIVDCLSSVLDQDVPRDSYELKQRFYS